MLKTGTVPVGQLPNVANGEGKSCFEEKESCPVTNLVSFFFPVKGKAKQTTEEEDEEAELEKLKAEMAMG